MKDNLELAELRLQLEAYRQIVASMERQLQDAEKLAFTQSVRIEALQRLNEQWEQGQRARDAVEVQPGLWVAKDNSSIFTRNTK